MCLAIQGQVQSVSIDSIAGERVEGMMAVMSGALTYPAFLI